MLLISLSTSFVSSSYSDFEKDVSEILRIIPLGISPYLTLPLSEGFVRPVDVVEQVLLFIFFLFLPEW